MEIALDQNSSLPIYAQLTDRIRHMIAAGELSPGEQLPTVRQLGVDLRVNPNTVARAYTELARQGVISSQQGRGTYIAEKPDAAVLARLRHDRLHSLAGRLVLEALSLGYRPEELAEAFESELSRWRPTGGGAAPAVAATSGS